MLARGKYRALSAEYTHFSKAINIPQQRERVTVDGLKKVGQGKYTPTKEPTKISSLGSRITDKVTDEERRELLKQGVPSIGEQLVNVLNARRAQVGKSVANSGESGIIEVEEFDPLSSEKVVPIFRKDSEKWIELLTGEEIRAIKKYTKNSGDLKDDKFYARLNAMLRGEIPDNDNLNYYSGVISNAILKFELQHDIICYRTLDFDAYKDYSVGAIFIDPQFISTSIVKSRT